MSRHLSTLTIAAAVVFAAGVAVAQHPVDVGDVARWKQTLLVHDMPVQPPDDDGRARPDDVGVVDLVAVHIELDFDGIDIPDEVRFTVELTARNRIEDGFPLLAAFYVPLAIREEGGADLEFVHSAETGELVVFLDRPLAANATRRYVIDADLTYACDTPPGCTRDRFVHIADAGWYPMNLEVPADDRFEARVTISARQPNQVSATGTRDGPTRVVGRRNEATFVTEVDTFLPSVAVGPYSITNGGTVEVFSPVDGVAPGAVEGLLEIGQDSISLYGSLFGRYPYSRLGMAAIDTAAGAGIGPQSNILLPDAFWSIPPDDPALWAVVREVTSHEIGHQYFFNLLHVVDPPEAWMSEAFAEYAATRVSEEATGTRDHARINYWSYVFGVAPGQDEPIFSESVSFNPFYFQIVYQKGSAALHALRYTVGSERWDAALSAWVRAYTATIVTTEEFERFLTESLGRDLTAFFDRWVYGAGVVELVVRATRGRTDRSPVTIEVEQRSEIDGPYEGSIPVRLHRPDGTVRDTAIAPVGPSEVELGDAQWVELDPDLTLFRRIRPDPAGDVNLDGVVDGMDLLDVRFADGRQAIDFGPAGEQPNPDWDDRLDADRNDRVDRRDADRVIEQFGVGWNRP